MHMNHCISLHNSRYVFVICICIYIYIVYVCSEHTTLLDSEYLKAAACSEDTWLGSPKIFIISCSVPEETWCKQYSHQPVYVGYFVRPLLTRTRKSRESLSQTATWSISKKGRLLQDRLGALQNGESHARIDHLTVSPGKLSIQKDASTYSLHISTWKLAKFCKMIWFLWEKICISISTARGWCQEFPRNWSDRLWTRCLWPFYCLKQGCVVLR